MALNSNDSAVVILDNGSHSIKIGLSTDDEEREIPTVYGTLRKSVSGDSYCKTYFGRKAQAHRGILTLEHPIRGEVQNWDTLISIWNDTFDHELKIEPSEHPFLIALPLLVSKSQHKKYAEIFFETFKVPSIAFLSQPKLASAAWCSSTGVVVDIGECQTQIVPCYEYEPISHAAVNFNISGSDITEQLRRNLNLNGKFLPPRCSSEIMREIKENCAFVNSDVNLYNEVEALKYELPDGQTILIEDERHECSEILFNPILYGKHSKGLHEEIKNVIMKCDETIQKKLFKNILLIGGTSKLKGLQKRLENELKAIAPHEVRVKSHGYEEVSTWMGGLIYANLSGFKYLLKTKFEYMEEF